MEKYFDQVNKIVSVQTKLSKCRSGGGYATIEEAKEVAGQLSVNSNRTAS